MQRSRKALLENRRALPLPHAIGFSLVFLFFLFSLWVSRGHSYLDGSEKQSGGVENWNEVKHGLCESSNTADKYFIKDTDACFPLESFHSKSVEANGFDGELHPGGERGEYALPAACDTENKNSLTKQEHEVESSESAVKHENDVQKSDHLSWAVPLGLDEFKSRAISSKVKAGAGPSRNVIHRVDPGGAEYNYASESKGAKVLGSNKEAKGASNVLSRNKDKYLRNPCSAEEKYVIIELSEETLVDTVEIANLEHHSSNLKDFEIYGSLSFPTDVWVFLGNFTASNVRHAQRFVLKEPKWVRYLKLNLQSHYGSEFYCTLSIVEVYGVDAVERMLEDLIYTQDNLSGGGNDDKNTVSPHPDPAESEHVNQNTIGGINSDPASDIASANHEAVNNKVPDPVEEIRQQVGRMPGDTVLKILMQKVRSLDLSLFVLERYMEDLNSRYVNIFKEYSKDIGEKDLLLQKIKEDIRNLIDQQDVITKDASDLKSWKSQISMQLDHLLRDNAVLRSEVEKVREKQISLENKGVVIFLLCCIFSLLAVLRLSLHMATNVCRALRVDRTIYSGKFCADSSSWFLLLLSCVIIFILIL
ncbi:SUN domain-containing protein 4-like [Lotus japonicus]|uniref:SUN domain-containing protein 4-like n=1 Tax=Lotus japonicus TaxID=34305 RepID=UPI00258D0106|nr:SUN domain-containing protein 4-like [Lotus japonicus]